MPASYRLLWSLLALAGLATGCAGYRLGPSGGQTPGAKSVGVEPFLNQTQEPRLTAAVTSSLRRTLQQDGTYKLNTRGDADVVVSGAILEYERSGVSFRPEDILTPRDYRVTLKVHVRALDRASGRLLVDREVVGRTTVRVGADLATAERQAIPLMADDLAFQATSLLVDGEW